MMSPAQMDGVYAALVTADGDQDADALAAICWQLYRELGTVKARADALQARFTAAAQALASPPPGHAAPALAQPAGTPR
ncbi:MAG TPA: hypothetical protein VH478_04545 [Trebonia sp.]|jgi:1,6-anhydro-N-acetylmuramate kinase|nr:hypothetical protein [Trebonia sp.]